ncbi:hypothetical protein MRS44_017843 [Fusarium solani]|uniref:uncharacterized protein n=1 Tax=Fusarium solani TaxID=169388 RepID=UPI0032C42585|nr:hypothetical protein MRS44_017843 [Fusarium solani]
MSSSSPVAHASPHLRKPLDTQRDTGGDMSMMFFAQPDCPFRFAHQDQHRIKGLNAETLASIFLPPPSWLLAAEYASLRSDVDDSPKSIFFSLNLSIYNQPIDASEWVEQWFFMNGRVHPYALAWEVKQLDGLESDAGRTLLYTMPALIVRDQGYQPVLPWPFASMDSFPCVPPVVSFAGTITGPGHSLLRQDLLPGLDPTQLKCCGFIQLSTYLSPGNPDKTQFRGFHPFQVFVIFPIHTNPWAILCKKMAKRRDSQFQPNAQFTCTGKVAGLLDHRACQWQGSQPSIRQQPAAYEIGRLNTEKVPERFKTPSPPQLHSDDTPKTCRHVRDLAKHRSLPTRRKYSKIAKGLEVLEIKVAVPNARITGLEEQMAKVRRGKKRKAVPNPNRRFMALAEALAAGEALLDSKEAEIEVDVDDEVESVIEVGVRSEDESEDFMVVRKHCQRTRSGWEVKNLCRGEL